MKKDKKIFQDCDCGNLLGFPIKKIIKESTGISVQEKLKIDFQDGDHGGHLGFLIRMILAIFLSTCCPDISYQVSSQMACWFKRSSTK